MLLHMQKPLEAHIRSCSHCRAWSSTWTR
jgi:predicted anti-sigma-YlaC factor YlaD